MIAKRNGTVAIPERRHSPEDFSSNRTTNTFPPFQNLPFDSNSSYLSNDPNGTLGNINRAGTNIPQAAFSVNHQHHPTIQRPHESQYLHPASLISSSGHTESRSEVSNLNQTQPKTLASPGVSSNERYLRLENSDATFPKVVNDVPTNQNASNLPPALNVYTHPMRNQRVATQNQIDHNTHPKTIVGTSQQELEKPKDPRHMYVNIAGGRHVEVNTDRANQVRRSPHRYIIDKNRLQVQSSLC